MNAPLLYNNDNSINTNNIRKIPGIANQPPIRFLSWILMDLKLSFLVPFKVMINKV